MKNITIGMDIGDKNHVVCVLNAEGSVICETTVKNDKKSLSTGSYPGRMIISEGKLS